MSATPIYPAGIQYRQPRPRGDAFVGTAVGALLGWLFTRNPGGAILGGALGTAGANQPMSLEAAVRAHFTTKGLQVINFYRLGPKAAKVLFRYRDQFWILESRAPESSGWTPDSLDDWLYGEIVEKQLPAKLAEIDARFNQ